jgi:murein DD-endopeptidase MepM/ murein hydrolase activator NlpD
MRNPSYHYNSDTCQYEQVKFQIRDAIWYGIGLLVIGSLMFVGLAVSYDRLTESDLEAVLKKENKALDKHQIILASQLLEVETSLKQLQEKDQLLHQKLFEETSLKVRTSSSADKKAMLMADASDFAKMLDKLTIKSGSLYDRSITTSDQFDTDVRLSKKNLTLLNSMPTLQPVANPDLDLLVSGFGTRINPFHKGKYKHSGIDFAAQRGTEVFAAASGRVIDINRSDLQAGYGNSIDIDHGHGFVTRYAHLEDIHVKQGQKVAKKMVIGTVGNSGGSIAPHLHYEVIYHGEQVNPLKYMIEGLNSSQYSLLVSLNNKQNQSLD